MKDDQRDSNPANPKDDPLERIAVLERRVAVLTRENERLETFLAVLCHRIFGRSSEKMSPDQFSLLDTAAPAPADPGEAEPSGEDTTGRHRRSRGGRRPLPDSLPRVTREILPASTQCPCCSREMARIGQDESKQLHLVPAHAEVHVTVRPKFACRTCGELAQAPAPDDRPIERGLPTAGTIAQVVIAKYLNHMPLHRQAAHYARFGVLLATTTLYGWVEAAARDLAPIADRLLELLLRRTKIHADDTPVTVLNPGRSGTHDGRFWVYADDTRPRGGIEPSIAVFRFSAGRAGKHPGQHLAGFKGTLQADAFSGFDHLYRGGAMVEAGCLGHARRKLVDLVRAKGSPVAGEGVKQIAALYRIERRIYGLPPAERLAVRQSEAVPLLDALRTWLTERLSQVAPRSELAKALGYMNAQWDALARYAADGTLEIDNLTAERALRGIAIGRKNWNVIGSDAAGKVAAVIYSLVETCRLNGINPEAYLTDVIGRIGRTKIQALDTLLPFNWRPPDASSSADPGRMNIAPHTAAAA
ncbi:IS66 family transposase [Skermanella pratensis]|uniref:IS66 family transposase n=1 Tax=Skermanella pratensis TaxID=2233999 RepID=UPI001300DEE9|nr:IS66 family transposase [Skermanella pratensis]